LAVAGTVEGADGVARQPAGRLDPTREEHQPGLAVALAHLAEELVPDILGVRQHHGDELLLLRLDLGTLRRLLVRDLVRRVALEDDPRVDPEDQANDHAEHGDASADRDPAAAAAGTATIVDVVALSPSLPFHAFASS